MKKIFGLLFGVVFAANVLAQENGVVVLHHDSIMETLLVKNEVTEKNNAITAVGYRVQVYSNNNARKAKTEAFELEEKLEIKNTVKEDKESKEKQEKSENKIRDRFIMDTTDGIVFN